MVRTVNDIKQLGSIMGVWAHPDDETFSSAGIMAAAISNQQNVVCLTATKGEAGSQNEEKWPVKKLAKIREYELREAFKVLGINNHHFLGYKDGSCDKVNAHIASSKISEYIAFYKPDSILTFGKEGITGHFDHITVSEWVDRAIELSGIKKPRLFHAVETREHYENYFKIMDRRLNIYFNIDKPILYEDNECSILLRLDEQLHKQKYQALQKMPSQTEIMMKLFDRQFLYKSLSVEAFIEIYS